MFRSSSLRRVHVEMVEPEVDEDFLELPLAIRGAQNLVGGKRDDLLSRKSPQLLAVGGVRLILRRRKTRLNGVVVDAARVKLLVQPRVQADLADVLDLARSRPER